MRPSVDPHGRSCPLSSSAEQGFRKAEVVGSIPTGGTILVRIVAPHFVAGFETDGTVRRAAPILRYMVGWNDDKVRDYVKKKGWTASIVSPR